MSVAVQMPLFPEMACAPRPARLPAPSPAPVRPTVDLCVLGSGSGGNATVLRHDGRLLLIDAGFGPRTTARRLAQAGAALDDLAAVCVTHFDTDHFRKTWPGVLLDRDIPLHLHHWHEPDLLRVPGGRDLLDAGLARTFDADPFDLLPGLTAHAVRLQHDRQGTVGYRLQADRGLAVGYCTDLGHAPDRLIDHLAGVDLLCIEANYDERMTINSPRPSFVNRRNLSDSGHLSNEQSLDAVQRIAAASPAAALRHVLLMHRSQQCNHPTRLRRVFEADPLIYPRITLTEQRRRTRWFRLQPVPAVRRCQPRLL